MKNQEKSSVQNKLWRLGLLYLALFVILICIINLHAVNHWLGWLFSLLRPVLIGLALAYLLNPLFRFFERRVFHRVRYQALRRVISLTCSYVLMLVLVASVVLLIVPQLIDSILLFLESYNEHISSAIAQINSMFSHINAFFKNLTGNEGLLEYLDEASIRESAAELFINLDKLSTTLMNLLSDLDIKPLQTFFQNALSVVTDSIFGIFVSIYLLASKEKRYTQIMKVRRALFSNKTNERITRFCTVADRSFGGFVEGKTLDSFLVGIILYILFTIFRIPYAIILATFIAITNFIPLLGLLIGSIPAVFILFLTAPGKVIPFLLIMLVMQQIDINIISPKILGSNTGVSSLCIIISISVMSHFWGLLGMLLAVPIFATALELLDEHLVSSLQKKGLPSGLANYYAPDSAVDPVKNAGITYNNAIQRFEKRAHYALARKEQGEKPDRSDRILLAMYRLAQKYHILTEMSDETHARYAAEEAVLAAEMQSDLMIARLHAQQATEASHHNQETIEMSQAAPEAANAETEGGNQNGNDE